MVVTPKQRWDQILQYCHTIHDLELFASGQGTVRLYHGAPAKFAQSLVEHGPHVPYTVYGLARRVAATYGLNWSQFQHYAFRKAEVVTYLSSAPAPVACRWAWSFTKGEILTDLNSHAMMVTASNALARSRGISVNDAYEELYNTAIELARGRGLICTTDRAPIILGLYDRMKLEDETGSLVELMVDLASVDDGSSKHDATMYLKEIERGEITKHDALAFWNNEYRDIRLKPSSIKSMRIVIRGMESYEQDVIERLIREGKLPLVPASMKV